MVQIIELHFKTVICCTNDGYLGKEWIGRGVDQSFLDELPANVDPCGENGEFHTFCYAGPVFKKGIDFTIGEKVYKALEKEMDNVGIFPKDIKTKGFWFCDLLPIE